MSNPSQAQPRGGIEKRVATPAAGRIYIGGVILAGLALLVWQFFLLMNQGAAYWIWFSLLVVAASLAGVKLPFFRAGSVTVTVADCFILMAFLVSGAPLAILLGAVEALATCLRFRLKILERVLFNMAQVPITVLIVTTFFAAVHGPFDGARDLLQAQFFLVMALGTILYFFVNSGLIALGMALSSGTPVAEIWRRHFPWLSPSFLANAVSAILFLLVFFRDDSTWDGIIWISLGITLLFVSRLGAIRAGRAQSS